MYPYQDCCLRPILPPQVALASTSQVGGSFSRNTHLARSLALTDCLFATLLLKKQDLLLHCGVSVSHGLFRPDANIHEAYQRDRI